MKRIVVTGSSGKATVQHLQENGYEVFGVDKARKQPGFEPAVSTASSARETREKPPRPHPPLGVINH
jgi:nucleoside-diphosphate-sugar epimerase